MRQNFLFNTYWPKILFTEKPFDECVSTNVLQLVHIGRNIFIEKKLTPFEIFMV